MPATAAIVLTSVFVVWIVAFGVSIIVEPTWIWPDPDASTAKCLRHDFVTVSLVLLVWCISLLFPRRRLVPDGAKGGLTAAALQVVISGGLCTAAWFALGSGAESALNALPWLRGIPILACVVGVGGGMFYLAYRVGALLAAAAVLHLWPAVLRLMLILAVCGMVVIVDSTINSDYVVSNEPMVCRKCGSRGWRKTGNLHEPFSYRNGAKVFLRTTSHPFRGCEHEWDCDWSEGVIMKSW